MDSLRNELCFLLHELCCCSVVVRVEHESFYAKPIFSSRYNICDACYWCNYCHYRQSRFPFVTFSGRVCTSWIVWGLYDVQYLTKYDKTTPSGLSFISFVLLFKKLGYLSPPQLSLSLSIYLSIYLSLCLYCSPCFYFALYPYIPTILPAAK